MKMRVELDGISEIKKGLDPKIYSKASARTIKEVGRHFRTQSVKEVRSTYNIKAKDLKSKMRTRTVTSDGEIAWQMEVKGRTINLIKFGARQTRRGVTVLVKRGGGRKLLAGAFIVRDSHGIERVFMRKTKARLPLSAKNTLSIPQMFNKKIVDKHLAIAKSTWRVKLHHNLDFYLGKLK